MDSEIRQEKFEFFNKEKQKAERLIDKVKMWKQRYNNCEFKDELKMDVKVVDWREKAKRHIEEIKKTLGTFSLCYDNDAKRLELAKILKMYKEELNLEGLNT